MTAGERTRCVLVGVAAGLAGGLFGVGGGIILVPMLTGVLKATQHQAHGTSLAVIGAVAAASLPIYALHGNVAWRSALIIAIASTAAALWGARLAGKLSADRLRLVFALFLVVVAVRLLWAPAPMGVATGPHTGPGAVVFDLVVGACVGVLSGFMGVGGGILVVPALTLLTGAAQQLAQGTSLAVILVTAPVGSIEHARQGNVLWRFVPWLSLGAALGAVATSWGVQGLPREPLARGFALFLLASALSTWVRSRSTTAVPAK